MTKDTQVYKDHAEELFWSLVQDKKKVTLHSVVISRRKRGWGKQGWLATINYSVGAKEASYQVWVG